MNEPLSVLERNVGYVRDLVKQRPGELDITGLITETRLRHDPENPLGIQDAREAIAEAERIRLIYKRYQAVIFNGVYHGPNQYYHPF